MTQLSNKNDSNPGEEAFKKSSSESGENIKKNIRENPAAIGFDDDRLMVELADFFKVLGDTTRIKILSLLFERDMYVNEIANRLGISQSAISHQLRVLKQARLVRYRRMGREISYGLDDEHVREVFEKAYEHVKEIY